MSRRQDDDWPESPVDKEVAYLPNTKDTSMDDELSEKLKTIALLDTDRATKVLLNDANITLLMPLIKQYTAQESLKARIDELEHIEVDGLDGGIVYSGKDGEDISDRITALTAQLNQVERGTK